jgi:heme oxygenase
MNDSWHRLEALPAAMAEAVRPHLAIADLEGYLRFLDAMVHYTRGSGERLRHAAEHAPTEKLRTFFSGLAREEAGHHKLAEADLAALGRRPGDQLPDGLAAFHRGWMEARTPAAWLGALYVLENVGGFLARDAAANLGRLKLGPRHVRFVMVHLEADVEHGADTADHARAEDPGALLAAGEAAAAFWVALHVGAFAAPGG